MKLPAARLATAVLTALVLALAVPAVSSASAVLDFEPSPVSFSDVGIHDQGQTQNVKVANHGDEDASLEGFSATYPFYIDYNATDCDDIGGNLHQGWSCNLAVGFDPDNPGPASGEATIDYFDGGGPSAATVPLSGSGARGTLQADSVNFNTQPYFYGGQQQQLDISNSSPYTVLGGSATVVGPDSSSFSVAWSGCNGNLVQQWQSCSLGVQFNGGAPGSYEAELEFSNDGTDDPLVVPLEVEVLRGPVASIDPSELDFGVVEVGAEAAPRSLTVTNVGDFPLEVQQMLIISGTPKSFPVSSDSCSRQLVMPGGECEMTIGFEPDRRGERNGSVFLISNTPEPVNTVSLLGEGMSRPDGSVRLTHEARVGVPLLCLTSGYREVDTVSYRWLRDGTPVPGEEEQVYVPAAGDAGAVLSCEVTAVNEIGSQTVTSAPSATVAAAEPGPQGPERLRRVGAAPSLFTTFTGSGARGYTLHVVSRNGLNEVHSSLSHLRIRAGRASGFVRARGPYGVRRLSLRGSSSVGGSGIVATLARRTIEVRALPRWTTSVTVGLRPGVIVGRRGRVRTTALVGEQSQPASASGRLTRLP